MSRKRSEEAILAHRDRFMEGAKANEVPDEVAERVFEQVRGFSGFGFPKAHAAAFGLLAYQSTWLRVHYGPELLCSLLNEQPMGFYPSDSLVHEAQRRGIGVLAPDVNESGVECAVQRHEGELAVRIGLGYVNGAREDEMRTLVTERERAGRYRGFAELASRAGVADDALERLAWAGACDSLDGAAEARASAAARRPALWQLGVASGAVRTGFGEQLALPLEVPEPPRLRELGGWELAVADYESTGMTLGTHPMGLIREELGLDLASSLSIEALANNSPIRVGGMVIARQRPATANGILFMLLEDEWGTINLIVPPAAYRRHRPVARAAPFVVADGRLEKVGANRNVVVTRLERLDRPGLEPARVRHIEPPADRETGRDAAREAAKKAAVAGGGTAELGAVMPPPHSFGRRGR
jgi:error-prone DNA polymerase